MDYGIVAVVDFSCQGYQVSLYSLAKPISWTGHQSTVISIFKEGGLFSACNHLLQSGHQLDSGDMVVILTWHGQVVKHL